MKVIDLSEAKANLEQYAQECQTSPIIVSINGMPSFEMLPVRADDDDFMDRLIEQNDEFRQLLERSRRQADLGQVSSLEEVRRRLG
jgi:hypothetical protein